MYSRKSTLIWTRCAANCGVSTSPPSARLLQSCAATSPTRSRPPEHATVAAVDAALAALGSPQELANEYLTDNLLARAEASRSPVRILQSLFHWASLSVAGFFVLIGSILGYFLGIVFILVAALKPFHPHTAGLWLLPSSAGDFEYSIRLGAGTAPVVGRELLGWWIVPIGLLVGCALLVLTTRFALWCARQYRRSHLLPRS